MSSLTDSAVSVHPLRGRKRQKGPEEVVTSSLIVEGGVSTDLYLSRETTAARTKEGLVLSHPSGTTLIKTEQVPEPGQKVNALEPLDDLQETPFVGESRDGGGGVNTVSAIAELAHGNRSLGELCLLTPCVPPVALHEAFKNDGFICACAGRQKVPINLIVGDERDRLIVKSPPAGPDTPLSTDAIAAIRQTVSRAKAIISVSAKCAALNALAMTSANGARSMVQLTGSLPLAVSLFLAARAHQVIENLSEWIAFARSAGVDVPVIEEKESMAILVAARTLEILRGLGLAGSDAAVCTLGRHGVVAADWVRKRIYLISLVITDGSCGVPTPAGVGDRFLGTYVYFWETWARQGFLRDPVCSCAQRAMHHVAEAIGLNRSRYELRVTINDVPRKVVHGKAIR